MIQDLKRAGVEYVRILWCDNANIIRAKAANVNLLRDGFDGVNMTVAQMALPVMFDAVAPDSGLGPVGEVKLEPDWSTLKILPYANGHAQVIANIVDSDKPWSHCPRDFLRKQINRLREHDIEIKAAFENEFFLLRKYGDSYESADRTVYAMTSSMNEHREFILEFSHALESQGLQPEYYYPESGPGQQELTIRYSDALGSADNQIVFRETAKGVASKYGLVASFLPKLYENAAGSGCHINLSLWQEDKNITGNAKDKTGLSETGKHFIAGVLHHLSALTALTLSTKNSFRRIRPHFWAGAFTAWGYDNREAAIRVSRKNGAATRFELKAADASSNPYLALGSMLAAGLSGIQEKLELPNEVKVDPALMSGAEKKTNHVHALPANLGEALAALEKNKILLGALGSERSKAYLAVKKMEWETLKDTTLEDEVKMLAERY
ncbi:MAG: glutamine synthetase family protein [Trueperaceae bacterium]